MCNLLKMCAVPERFCDKQSQKGAIIYLFIMKFVLGTQIKTRCEKNIQKIPKMYIIISSVFYRYLYYNLHDFLSS